ncbi:hypothetical protein N7491_005412 [Penicillium cf. griseofulvum]|uniref:Uncharacterized protein n=1 Tax=Penicillium cf. griseofulvum TaxID=2972120 RepID=A0A9W9J1S2_9EURO|nr:hypothetical protein N7472_008103 [Penicillium cf. griseofulvum]KAJ5434817.1 hypothetical protein N7491_005412 [Penicillium cf. griseofulvum]KAJ5452650.1 hypothetical protein N7445_000833 [Penicillium cf. griseofulvum]
MTSWPGVRDCVSRALCTADGYTNNRSEVCLPNISLAPTSGPESQKGARATSSAASEILQPLSPLTPRGFAPITTSTAPIFGHAGPDTVDYGDEATENEPWSQNPQQWNEYDAFTESSAASFQIQYSPEIDGPTNWYRVPAPPPEPARDTSAKVAKLIGEVLSAHEDVSVKRYRIREMRHMLRQKRDEEDDVRVALQSKLNLITAEHVLEDITAINHTISDLQVVTSSYFIFENEYQRQEEELAQLEYDYDRRLESLHTIFKNQGGSLAHLQPVNSDPKSSSADYTSDYGDQVLPQVADYLSMIGEARILAERLAQLETEYLVLVDQRELRERVGIPLDSAALNFLLRYQNEKNKIETELEITRRNVESHPEHLNLSAQIEEDNEEEMIQHFMPEIPEDPTYNDPLHSSEYEDLSPFFASAHPHPINKGNFVNRWLLHRLRHSRVEIMRFKSAPELIDLDNKGWGSDNISKMAMMLWFQDGAASMEHIRSQSAM